MRVATRESLTGIVTRDTTVFWFRRDLRLSDNVGLYHALMNHKNVLPVFIFDSDILDTLDEKSDRRVEFIFNTLIQIKRELEQLGSSILIWNGKPVDFFDNINPHSVYCNNDYEPYAIERDHQVKNILEAKGIGFHTFKDHVIFETNEVIKDDGSPYTIFTPYSVKWKSKLKPSHLKSHPTEKYMGNFHKLSPLPHPLLAQLGFRATGAAFPERKIKLNIIEHYHLHRDFPYHASTTRLGVHLRFGTVSIRQLVSIALEKNETWLNELIWREFYQAILWHFPYVEKKCFKMQYEDIEWRNDEAEFNLWCQGKTGYPLVDAGMRELNATGFMHNRVRMVAASFLTKHLLIDWRWGEAYFAKKLLDYDLAANNGGWQWAAGCGCDAAPYFRLFNPTAQAERFDPDMKYIKKWIPEWNTANYPHPIIDHHLARERAVSTYKNALQVA
jgi:deoxyribodipyrimidine photo-lyase